VRFVYVWQRKKLEGRTLKRKEKGREAIGREFAAKGRNKGWEGREGSFLRRANMGDDSRGWS
jgi:hypothetical protein